MIKNKVMFMAMDIPTQVTTIMNRVNSDSEYPFDKASFDAGVKQTLQILEQLCTDDEEHIVAHIPDMEVAEEFTYDDFKKLPYVKNCVCEVEM